MLLTWILCLWASLAAQEEVIQETTAQTAQDSLEALLTEPILDSLIVGYADSLFLPSVGDARIFRDLYGIPHIYGETDRDCAFGFGYAQAEDHLVDMLISYRMARGCAAELLGQDWIESDFKSRHWRVEDVAGEQYGAISESTRNLIAGFVDGVNHYIDIHRQGLPEWVDEVRGVDVVAASRWMVLLFAEASGRSELVSKGITPTLDEHFASNQIVIGPERALEGSGLSIADLHLPWRNPFRLYEAHLKSREGMDVSGATFFGWPVIVVGHTNRIAWSFTSNDADIFDLYEEKLDPANPRRYLFEREKLRLSSRRERVRVRTEFGVEEVERELQYSHHGPVYKVVDQWAYAARTSADDVTDVIDQLYQVNRATDLRLFRAALSRLQIPLFNATYADVDGNIYYVFLSRTPIRAEKFDWRNPVPGWSKETDWGGILPFSQLPQVVNPDRGFLQNCNTPPDAVTPTVSLERSGFPSYLGWGSMNDRGRRTLTWLSSTPVVSVEQAIDFARDEYLLSAEELKAFILRAYNGNWQELYDPESLLATAISTLRDWDNHASVDSRGALLFATWKARYDDLYAQLAAEQRTDLNVLERLALEALQGSVAYLRSTFGRVDVRLREVHRVVRGDRSYPVGGTPPGTVALHQMWSTLRSDGAFEIWGGSAYTSVISLSSPPAAWTALHFGNSEDPGSPHYADQAELQTGNRLKQTWMADEDVLANVTNIRTVPYRGEALELERLRAWWSHRRQIAPEVQLPDSSIVPEP